MSTALDLPSYLAGKRREIDAALEKRMEEIAAQGTPVKLAEAMRYSLLAGGKRLRPTLCLAFAEAISAQNQNGDDAVRPERRRRLPTPPTDLTWDAATAVEFIHTYSLIHDDLPAMDDDDLRRGRPTNHKVHGEAMAILAGDALLTEAFACVASAPRCVTELSLAAGARGMVGGQVFDIAEERSRADFEYVKRLHALKTGKLIRASCMLGALSVKADEALVERAAKYGEAVGLAFQIADDILDVTGDEESLGKPVGADAASGRVTFPSLLGVDGARKLAKEAVQQAVEAIAPLGSKAALLQALAHYSIERTH